MSAVLKEIPELHPMRENDLAEVVAVERVIYDHPWTHGNFADSLRAGYQCWVSRFDAELIGYFVLMVAVGEAHLLNLSVAASQQRRGHGRALLAEAMRIARTLGGRHIFLEVRPSNDGAQRLYQREGFRRVAVRRGYYPSHAGREDAIVLSREL